MDQPERCLLVMLWTKQSMFAALEWHGTGFKLPSNTPQVSNIRSLGQNMATKSPSLSHRILHFVSCHVSDFLNWWFQLSQNYCQFCRLTQTLLVACRTAVKMAKPRKCLVCLLWFSTIDSRLTEFVKLRHIVEVSSVCLNTSEGVQHLLGTLTVC